MIFSVVAPTGLLKWQLISGQSLQRKYGLSVIHVSRAQNNLARPGAISSWSLAFSAL